MKGLNGQSSGSQRRNSSGEGSNNGNDATRRSARIQQRNLKRRAPADDESESGDSSQSPPIPEQPLLQSNGAMDIGMSSSNMLQECMGNDQAGGQVAVANGHGPGPSGPSGHMSRGRKRSRNSGPSAQRRRMYYTDMSEARMEANGGEGLVREGTGGRTHRIVKPIPLRPAIPPGPMIIRPPVQPPHLEVPKFRSYEGSFQWVDPRRQEEQNRQDLQEQQLYQQQQQIQQWNDQYLATAPPMLDYYGQAQPDGIANEPAVVGQPMMQAHANAEQMVMHDTMGYVPPMQSPAARHDELNHSILVRILNSGMDWQAQRAYHYSVYGMEYPNANPNQGNHPM